MAVMPGTSNVSVAPAGVDISQLPQAAADLLVHLLLGGVNAPVLNALASANDLVLRVVLPGCRADLGDCLERHEAATGKAIARLVLVDDAGLASGLMAGLPPSWVPLYWPTSAEALSLALQHAIQLCRAIGSAADTGMSDSSSRATSYGKRLVDALTQTGLYDFEYDFSTGERSRRMGEIDILGLTPRNFEEMLQLVHPDDRSILRNAHESSRNTGCRYQVEMRIWFPSDQSWRWTRSQAVVVDRNADHPGYLTGVTYEIHRDRLARNELAQARVSLEHALGAAGMFAWEWNDGLQSRHVIADGLGIATAQETGLLENSLHPDDAASDIAQFADAMQCGGVYANTVRVRASCGNWRWIQMHGKVNQPADGQPARYAGFGVDISAYRGLCQELVDARALLETTLSAGRMYCWEWNTQSGQRRTVGPAREILGTESELISNAIAQVHPDDVAADEELVRRTLEDGSPYSNEFRLIRPDGGIRWLYSRGFRSVDDEQVTRFSGVSVDITELREAEANIRRLNRQLEIALEAAGLNPWSVDLRSNVHQAGPRDAAIFGRELRDTKDFRSHVLPEDLVIADCLYDPQWQASQRPIHLEFRIRSTAGDVRWVSLHSRALCDARGVPIELIGISCDVTEARRSEQSLKEALAKLERVQRATGVVLWEWTRQSGLRTQDVTGSTAKKMSATGVHPRDRWRVIRAIAQCRLTDGIFDQEFRIEESGGCYRWVWAQGRRSDEKAGEDARFSGILLDVSRAKRAELRLSESLAWKQQAAVAGELNLWCVDLISGARSGGALDHLLFGFVPRTLAEVESLIHPEDAPAARVSWIEAVRQGTPYEAEYRVRTAGVGERWLRARGQCVPSADGSGRQMVGATLDVTDQHRARDDLQTALRIAREASDAKSAFLAAVSHELRTPLNAVIGYSGLLAQQQSDSAQRSNLRALRAGADQLLTVINDVLDFSRIEAGAMELEDIVFDPLDCLEGAIQLVANAAEEKGLCLLGSCAGNVVQVLGDPTRYRQIILNLLSNGIKFTPTGTIWVTLDVAGSDSARELRLTVADSGIGMSDGTVSKVFEAFRQADESTTRRFGGSGLGLSIVRRLVSRMGGRIDVQTELGKGSCFTVSIPGKSAVNASQANTRLALPPELRAGVCVSNNAVREVLERQIRSSGAQVVHFESAQSLGAVDLWQSLIDVLIVGRPILAQLVKLEGWSGHAPTVPLVVLNGTAHPPHAPIGAFGERVISISRSIKPRELHQALLAGFAWQTGSPDAMKAPLCESAGSEVTQLPLQVLVVEDNDVNRLLMEAQLAVLGITATLVACGADALDLIQHSSFDVILMDVEMPGLDGLETTRLIRAQREGQRQPFIIAVTAHVLAEMQQGIRDAGMDDFVSKPVILQDLQDALARVAHRR